MLTEEEVVVVGSCAGAGGRQSGLLDQIVLGVIAIEGEAEEPLGIGRLGPVEASGEEIVTKRNGDAGRDGDGIDAGDEAIGGELSESIEL